MHCDGCSCASDIGASLDAQLADATPSALRDGRDLLIRDGALVVRRYGRPVGAVMICDCCGHEFFGTPNGVRLCNRNNCVAAFVKMHVGHTVRALGPSSAAPDADEGADAFGDCDDDELAAPPSPRAPGEPSTVRAVSPEPADPDAEPSAPADCAAAATEPAAETDDESARRRLALNQRADDATSAPSSATTLEAALAAHRAEASPSTRAPETLDGADELNAAGRGPEAATLASPPESDARSADVDGGAVDAQKKKKKKRRRKRSGAADPSPSAGAARPKNPRERRQENGRAGAIRATQPLSQTDAAALSSSARHVVDGPPCLPDADTPTTAARASEDGRSSTAPAASTPVPLETTPHEPPADASHLGTAPAPLPPATEPAVAAPANGAAGAPADKTAASPVGRAANDAVGARGAVTSGAEATSATLAGATAGPGSTRIIPRNTSVRRVTISGPHGFVLELVHGGSVVVDSRSLSQRADKELWLRCREELRVTASELAAVLDVDRHCSRRALLRLKAGLARRRPGASAAAELGTELERGLRNAYARATGRDVEQTGLWFRDCSIGASPDGLFKDQDTGKTCLLEIKCPSSSLVLEGAAAVVDYYQPQVQAQLEVCDMEGCDLVLRTESGFEIVRIQRDRAWWKTTAVPALAKFAKDLEALRAAAAASQARGDAPDAAPTTPPPPQRVDAPIAGAATGAAPVEVAAEATLPGNAPPPEPTGSEPTPPTPTTRTGAPTADHAESSTPVDIDKRAAKTAPAPPLATSPGVATDVLDPRRQGNWTIAEEEYMAELIEAFDNGQVEGLADRTNLRDFLARRLNCDPMRITKKLKNKRNMGDKTAFYRWWVRTSFQSIGASPTTAAAEGSTTPQPVRTSVVAAPGGAAGVLAAERSGAVSDEERAFVERLIQSFKGGLLQIPEGTSLRGFLAASLHCKEPRVTKQFLGGGGCGDNRRPPYARSTAAAAAFAAEKRALDGLYEAFVAAEAQRSERRAAKKRSKPAKRARVDAPTEPSPKRARVKKSAGAEASGQAAQTPPSVRVEPTPAEVAATTRRLADLEAAFLEAEPSRRRWGRPGRQQKPGARCATGTDIFKVPVQLLPAAPGWACEPSDGATPPHLQKAPTLAACLADSGLNALAAMCLDELAVAAGLVWVAEASERGILDGLLFGIVTCSLH